MTRRRFTITGAVQGVGFRPFVYRIALDHSLTGSVRNTPEGVIIEVQAPGSAVDSFGTDLHAKLPPLASIVTCDVVDLDPVANEDAFEIVASTGGAGHSVLISPDVATCPDCLEDLFNPGNPRHLYPFTNCTNCGPRYTITRSIPYDRDKTSMACFPMCSMCAAEYTDPLDRRFHAQPNACPDCGPHVWLTRADAPDTSRSHYTLQDTEALRELARLLAAGEIAAIKGLGGFHLACDATNAAAVATLRERKNRYGKPLGVMVPDLDAAKRLVTVSEAEADWLTGIKRPIVLCPSLAPSPLAPQVAPDTPYTGIMLPYTPLHHVLFRFYAEACKDGRVPALVMTSGNLSSEPISLGNREAISRLSAIADVFLLHDRDILIRCDDSVVRVVDDGENAAGTQFLRRARGFTPSPVFLSQEGPTVLGTGPELKTTLCLTKGDQAFVGQHIGTMENLETFGFYKEIAAHLEDILQVEPQAVVCDLHPDYMTTQFAQEFAERRGVPLMRVQHHVAHAHAVLAENQFDGKALCLTLDGTGYGEDGTLWGGEALLVDNMALTHERLAHFSPVGLPGGEAAIREPWRIAQSFLHAMGIREPDAKPWPWLKASAPASKIVAQMLDKGLNCPATSSCGRLFDAVSAMLGLKMEIAYEAEAAIVLESAMAPDDDADTVYPLALRPGADGESATLDTQGLFKRVYEDWQAGVAPGVVSRRFHRGIVTGLADAAVTLCREAGVETVGLCGGVMLNMALARQLPRALRARGLTPLVHRSLPPGDGSISLGQAAWGMRALAANNK